MTLSLSLWYPGSGVVLDVSISDICSSKGHSSKHRYKGYRIDHSTGRICLKHDFVQETNNHSNNTYARATVQCSIFV